MHQSAMLCAQCAGDLAGLACTAYAIQPSQHLADYNKVADAFDANRNAQMRLVWKNLENAQNELQAALKKNANDKAKIKSCQEKVKRAEIELGKMRKIVYKQPPDLLKQIKRFARKLLGNK